MNPPVLHPETGMSPHFTLRLYPDDVLRQICSPVERFDSTLQDQVEEMKRLMHANAGIGLAAPQAGLTERLFVAEIEDRFLCLVNPEIYLITGHQEQPEGCLSLPGVQFQVARHSRLKIRGFNEHGRKKQYTMKGLWARLAQHELDHLNGILISDRGVLLETGCQECPLLAKHYGLFRETDRKKAS